MFFGAYDEKDKKEIPLNYVNPKVVFLDFLTAVLNELIQEFKEMLAVLYPSGQKIKRYFIEKSVIRSSITDNSVFFILKLADRFQIKVIFFCFFLRCRCNYPYI